MITLPPAPVTRQGINSSHEWCPFAYQATFPQVAGIWTQASSGSTVVSPTVVHPTPFVITEFRGGEEINSGGFFRKGSFLLEKVTLG